MAQTRKRRQTKHRGNAAGMVESRGRTGRRPEPGERKKLDAKAEARLRREQRLNSPPTWRGSLNRAAIAAAFAEWPDRVPVRNRRTLEDAGLF